MRLKCFKNNQKLRLYIKIKNYKKHKNKECGMFPIREIPFLKAIFLKVAGQKIPIKNYSEPLRALFAFLVSNNWRQIYWIRIKLL